MLSMKEIIEKALTDTKNFYFSYSILIHNYFIFIFESVFSTARCLFLTIHIIKKAIIPIQ
jgi:hypothetical protein